MLLQHVRRCVPAGIAVGLLPVWAAALLAAPLGGGGPRSGVESREPRTRAAIADRSVLRVDVPMVLVPVTVTDAMDRPVMDLTRTSFRVLENNVEQNVLSFHREEGPVSIGFVFDFSRSMRDRMGPSIGAIHQFMDTLLPGDEFFLICFNDHVKLVTEFTERPDDILQELESIQPDGFTAMNDAIYFGVQHMKRAKNARKVLLVLTDGGDNASRYSESEVRGLVRECDVRLYSLGMFVLPRFLERLASESGGRAMFVRNLSELSRRVETASSAVRSGYVLGYAPMSPAKDGKYRRVRVELVQNTTSVPLHLSFRRGYYSPTR